MCSSDVLIPRAAQVPRILQPSGICEYCDNSWKCSQGRHLLKGAGKERIQCDSPEMAQWLHKALCDSLLVFKMQVPASLGLYFPINKHQSPTTLRAWNECVQLIFCFSFVCEALRTSLLGSHSSVWGKDIRLNILSQSSWKLISPYIRLSEPLNKACLHVCPKALSKGAAWTEGATHSLFSFR